MVGLRGLKGSVCGPALVAPMVNRLPFAHELGPSWSSSQWPAEFVSVVPLRVIVEHWPGGPGGQGVVGLFGSGPSKLNPSPINICAVNPAGSGLVTTWDLSPAELENPSSMNTVCVGRAGLENTTTRASPSMLVVLFPSLAIQVVLAPRVMLA